MNDDPKEFWQATWSAWRSGVLATLSPTYAKSAACGFDDFMRTSADVKDPGIAEFFASHPTRPGEFLIAFGPSGERPQMVLTSQRLWIYDKVTQQLDSFELSDVAEFHSKSGWASTSARVRFKDNTERIYEKIDAAPTDQAVGLAIQQCNAAEERNAALASAESETQAGTPQCPYCAIPLSSPVGPVCPKCNKPLGSYEYASEYLQSVENQPEEQRWEAALQFFQKHPLKGTTFSCLQQRVIRAYAGKNARLQAGGNAQVASALKYASQWRNERLKSLIQYLSISGIGAAIAALLGWGAYSFFQGEGYAALLIPIVILLFIIGPFGIFWLFLKFTAGSITGLLKALEIPVGQRKPQAVVQEFVNECTGLLLGAWDVQRLWLAWSLISQRLRAIDDRLSPGEFRGRWKTTTDRIVATVCQSLRYEFNCCICGRSVWGCPSFWEYRAHNYKEAKNMATGVVNPNGYVTCTDCQDTHALEVSQIIIEPAKERIVVFPEEVSFEESPGASYREITMFVPMLLREARSDVTYPNQSYLPRPKVVLSVTLETTQEKGKWWIATPFLDAPLLVDSEAR